MSFPDIFSLIDVNTSPRGSCKFRVGDLVMVIKQGNVMRAVGSNQRPAVVGMIGEIQQIEWFMDAWMCAVAFQTVDGCWLAEQLLKKVEPPDDDGEVVPEVKERELA